MEELKNVEQFLNYFRKNKLGFVCVEPKGKGQIVDRILFFCILDIIEPETIAFKDISKHGKTFFIMQFININKDWIPYPLNIC